jgi:hypothetical protein
VETIPDLPIRIAVALVKAFVSVLVRQIALPKAGAYWQSIFTKAVERSLIIALAVRFPSQCFLVEPYSVTRVEGTGYRVQFGDAIESEPAGSSTQMRATGSIFVGGSADRQEFFVESHESIKNRRHPAEMLFSRDSRNNSYGLSV